MLTRNRVCNDCKALAVDILAGCTRASDRWDVRRSDQAELSYAKGHLDGSIASLRESAARGCRSCRLLAEKVREINDESTLPPIDSYHIFVWDKVPRRCVFQIVTGDLDVFLMHVQHWRPIKTLEFFGLATSAPKLPDIEIGRPKKGSSRPKLSRLPFKHPGSAEAMDQARQWMSDCLDHHATCTRPESILPKRVLDLSRLDEERRVSLYIPEGEVRQPYAALSYTWGEKTRLMTTDVTKKKTKKEQQPVAGDQRLMVKKSVPLPRIPRRGQQFLTVACWDPANIPLAAFQRTQRDAILVAKALGFHYIWIDSLCIIQSDDNEDWAAQGAAMTDIYGRPAVVISASSAEDSSQGILGALKNERIAIGTWRDGDPSSPIVEIFLGETLGVLDLEEKFISTRGWVFQERLVSTATLHYTDEGMVWECAHGTRPGHDQNVHGLPWKADWRRVLGHGSRDAPLGRPLPGGKSQNDLWFDWICAYSARDLYDNRDKFPAIAGMANVFEQKLGSTYVAGLWTHDIVVGLLWRRHNFTETLIRLRDPWVAPSWSWASAKGQLQYRNVQLLDSAKGPTLEVDLDQISIFEIHEGSYGELQPGASIVVRGELQRVTVDRHVHPSLRQRPYQECGISRGFRNPENVLCMLDEWAESAPRHDNYWCLRVGSHDVDEREADVFLLLDLVSESPRTFCRVGYVETDAWCDVGRPTPMSGALESPSLEVITLV
jgi:hypothetical protein